jgi:hypothetical protein
MKNQGTRGKVNYSTVHICSDWRREINMVVFTSGVFRSPCSPQAYSRATPSMHLHMTQSRCLGNKVEYFMSSLLLYISMVYFGCACFLQLHWLHHMHRWALTSILMSAISDIRHRHLLFRYRRQICWTEKRHSDIGSV